MTGRTERAHRRERERVLGRWLTDEAVGRGAPGADVPARRALYALAGTMPGGAAPEGMGMRGLLASMMVPAARHDVREHYTALDDDHADALRSAGYADLFNVCPWWSKGGVETLGRILPDPTVRDAAAVDLVSLLECDSPLATMTTDGPGEDVPRTLRRFAASRGRDRDVPIASTVAQGLRTLETWGTSPRILETGRGTSFVYEFVWLVGSMPPEWRDPTLADVVAPLCACRSKGASVVDLVRGYGGRWKDLRRKADPDGIVLAQDVGHPLEAFETAVKADVRERIGILDFKIGGDGWRRTLWDAFYGRAGLGSVAEKCLRWNEDVAFLPRDADAVRWPAPMGVRTGEVEIEFLSSTTDLFEEGRRMDHCVARLAAAYADGRRWVARLRVGDAWATAEGTFDGRVLQCRTVHNDPAPWAERFADEAGRVARGWRASAAGVEDGFVASEAALANAQRVGEWEDWSRYLAGPPVARPFDHAAFDPWRDLVLRPKVVGRVFGPPATGREPVPIEALLEGKDGWPDDRLEGDVGGP